MATLLE